MILTVFLFSFQQALNEKDLFFKQSSFLREDNNRNNYHLQSIITDIKNYPFTIFWKNFSTDNYKEYWNYISLNYNQYCKNLYADLTMGFDILNNMINTRNNLIIKPGFIQVDVKKLNLDIIDSASSTVPVLNEIVGKCQ